MANVRPARRKSRGGLIPECLEARNLPSGGGAGLANVLRELGPVSAAAALRGVAATATIDPGAAVTFRFEVEAGGRYTLFVRHDGAGLTLEAQSPAGTAAIDPGPAGPFQAVRLDLGPGTYEVVAAARGGQPVFVDWELLLNSGVGQAPATSVGSVVPSVAIPLSSRAASPAPVAAGDSTPTPGSAEASPSAGAAAMALAQAHSAGPMRYSAGGPVGRLSAGSPSPVRAAAPAPEATEGLASGTLGPLDAALLVGIEGLSGRPGADAPAQAEPSWLDDLARSIAGSQSVEPVAEGGSPSGDPIEVAALLPEAVADEGVSLTSISPGVLLVGVVATAASRRVRRQAGQTFRQTWPSGSPDLGATKVLPRWARGRCPRVELARSGQPLWPPGMRNPRGIR